jgi:hypothetical protein
VKRKKVLAIGIVAVAILAAGIYGFPVREVRCVLNDHILAPESTICRQLQLLRGTRLLFRNFQQDKRASELLYLEDTKETFDIQRVEKSLSGSVTFFLTDQPPLYRMQQDDQTFLIAADGSRRENNEHVAAPLVSDPGNVYAEYPEDAHAFLAQFLRHLEKHQARIRTITLASAQRVEIKADNFPVILAEIRQDPLEAARRLTLIFDRVVPSQIDAAAAEIDLRFTLPVVRTFHSDDSSVLFSALPATDAAQVLIDSQE